jgi:hypothetical protein
MSAINRAKAKEHFQEGPGKFLPSSFEPFVKMV